MTRQELKQELKRREISQVKVARRFRVKSVTISTYLAGRMVSRPLDRKFARLLGMDEKERFEVVQ